MLRVHELLCFDALRFILQLLEIRDLERCFIDGKAGCYVEKLGCMFTFHSLSELFSCIIIFPVWWKPVVFPLKHYHDHSLSIKTVSRKFRMFPHIIFPPHIPSCFGPSAHRQLYFCSRFLTALFDVPLVLQSCNRFEVLYKLGITSSNKFLVLLLAC